MRASPNNSFRKMVTTGSIFHWHRMDDKTCSLVWHIQPAQWTQSVPSGEHDNLFKSADKVAAFKVKQQLWGWKVWVLFLVGFFNVSNISRDFERDWARASFSQMVRDHLSQLSKGFEHYFQTRDDPQTGKEWICSPLVNKPGELTLAILGED